MGSGMSSYRRPRPWRPWPWRPRPRGFVLDGSKGMLPLLGLQVLLEYGRADSARPPATAALLAANVLIFLRPGSLDRILPKRSYVAFNPNLFLKFRDLKTFFLSPLYHGNELHLFCNMTTLLWLGVQLETSMGTAEFASMIVALLGLSQGMLLLLATGLSLLGDDIPYYDHFSVGFSGVLFGMKAVMAAQSDVFMSMFGMIIPAKYALWAEAFIIEALVPNSSFLGHLGGILAGHVYLQLKHSSNGPDPLTLLVSGSIRAMGSSVRFAQKLLRSVLPKRHIVGRGRVGCCASARDCPKGFWRCPTCTYYNSLATDICERCSTMREACALSWRQHQQASCNGAISVEEMRLRRVHRFHR